MMKRHQKLIKHYTVSKIIMILKGKVSNTPSRRVPYMEVVGQVHGTYIIAQNENGMFMIDQHAAQERIKYEYFREKLAK